MKIEKIIEEVNAEIFKKSKHSSHYVPSKDLPFFLFRYNDFYVKVNLHIEKYYYEYRSSVTLDYFNEKLDFVRNSAGLNIRPFNSGSHYKYLKLEFSSLSSYNYTLYVSEESSKKFSDDSIDIKSSLPVFVEFLDQINDKAIELVNKLDLIKLHEVMNLGVEYDFPSYSYNYENSIVFAYFNDKNNIEKYLEKYQKKASVFENEESIIDYNKVVKYICNDLGINSGFYLAKRMWYHKLLSKFNL